MSECSGVEVLGLGLVGLGGGENGEEGKGAWGGEERRGCELCLVGRKVIDGEQCTYFYLPRDMSDRERPFFPCKNGHLTMNTLGTRPARCSGERPVLCEEKVAAACGNVMNTVLYKIERA